MKKLLITISLLLSLNVLFAQSGNDNIIITNRVEKYEYFILNNQVMVKEKTVTTYECTKMPASITVYEMYNNQSSIDKVKIKGIRGVSPRYNLYTSGEIFYTDAKVCHFKLYFDAKGKTAEVEIEKTYKDPRYFTSIYLSQEEYVRRKEIQIIVPEWMNADFKEYNFTGRNIQKNKQVDVKGNAYIYSYIITDEAAMKQESSMQGRSHIFPHIFIENKSAIVGTNKITFFETLTDLYNWCYNIIAQVNNDEAVIARKAEDIVKDCETDLDKIKAIYGWVQENIRYIAFEDGIAGFKPDDAHEVLRKKYGDCKGMANLVKCLLKSQGFDARLTWIGTNHIVYDYSTPSLAVNNHMICTLFHDGVTYYLDPTVEYMPLGEYPETIQGRQAMIEDGDNFMVNRLAVFEPQFNADSLYSHYVIEDGVLKGKAFRSFRGEAKQTILSLIHSTPKDKIDEVLKYFVEDGKVQDKASEIVLNNATSQTAEVIISYEIENNSGIHILGEECYIDLNANKDLMSYTIDTRNRENDVFMDYKLYHVRQILLEIPDNYEIVHLPENLEISKEGYGFHISYEKQGKAISYTCKLQITNPHIRKSEFDVWNADIENLKRNYMDQVVLKIND